MTLKKIKTILTLALVVMVFSVTSANAGQWTPTELKDGLELWLDADDADTITVETSGNASSAWRKRGCA